MKKQLLMSFVTLLITVLSTNNALANQGAPRPFSRKFIGVESTGCEFYFVAGEVGKIVSVSANENQVTLKRRYENGISTNTFKVGNNKSSSNTFSVIKYLLPIHLDNNTTEYTLHDQLFQQRENNQEVLFTTTLKMSEVNGVVTKLDLQMLAGDGSKNNGVSCRLERVQWLGFNC